MQRTKHGFTLIETTVVLVIASLILSLSVYMVHHINFTHYQNEYFWKEFHEDFRLYENLARERHSAVTIVFRPHQQVNFFSQDPKIRHRRIKEPRDLSPKKIYKIKIDNNGQVDPSDVVWVINGRRLVYQKFQMGWGMYVIEDHL